MERVLNVKCIIKEVQKKIENRFGEPKEIIVDSYEWQSDGERGKSYTYHMSPERFERPIGLAYDIYLVKEKEKENNQPEEIKVCTIGYYDFVDYNYSDCISDRRLEAIANEVGESADDLYDIIENQLLPLQDKIRANFRNSPEYQAKVEHERIIENYRKAKRSFSMQYGFQEREYDRCYNVFGQLMDADYLGKLNKIIEEREKDKQQSKKYRKEYYRSRFNDYFSSGSSSVDYSEEDREILAKFYKVLAKKYHPDANPDVDTSNEMILINKLKKAWRV